MTELTDRIRQAAKQALVEFDWGDYGLDEVGLAESDDWAEAAATAVIEAVRTVEVTEMPEAIHGEQD